MLGLLLLALPAASTLALPSPRLVARGTWSSTCTAPESPSCSSSVAPPDTCCTNYPGGQVVLTQFWEFNSTYAGPSDAWTIHGLWPDHCDGSYDSSCDPSREVTDSIADILVSKGEQATLDYMNTWWPDWKGDNQYFWSHEFNKHATCISTLEPSCIANYQPQDDVAVFFNKAVEIQKTRPTYEFLAAAGIVPSTTATYALSDIMAALEKATGAKPTVRCTGGALHELWYSYYVSGSIIDGTFHATDAVGTDSNCPEQVSYPFKKTA